MRVGETDNSAGLTQVPLGAVRIGWGLGFWRVRDFYHFNYFHTGVYFYRFKLSGRAPLLPLHPLSKSQKSPLRAPSSVRRPHTATQAVPAVQFSGRIWRISDPCGCCKLAAARAIPDRQECGQLCLLLCLPLLTLPAAATPATLAATVVAACAAVVGTRLLLRWRQRLREEQEAFSAQPFNGAVTLAATAPAALLPAATVGLDRLERLR